MGGGTEGGTGLWVRLLMLLLDCEKGIFVNEPWPEKGTVETADWTGAIPVCGVVVPDPPTNDPCLEAVPVALPLVLLEKGVCDDRFIASTSPLKSVCGT
jgi:hypothetical protein